MHKRIWACSVSAGLLVMSAPAHASKDGWADASDIARGGLVAAALAIPAVQEDWTGDKEAAFSIGTAFAVTQGLKWAIDEERPDGSDNNSLPSSHAATSFASAGTLYRRYGWEVGLPAHAVATFVAVARVKADKHFVQDVVAGAVIGEASAWLLTNPANENVKYWFWGDTKGGGATLIARF